MTNRLTEPHDLDATCDRCFRLTLGIEGSKKELKNLRSRMRRNIRNEGSLEDYISIDRMMDEYKRYLEIDRAALKAHLAKGS